MFEHSVADALQLPSAQRTGHRDGHEGSGGHTSVFRHSPFQHWWSVEVRLSERAKAAQSTCGHCKYDDTHVPSKHKSTPYSVTEALHSLLLE